MQRGHCPPLWREALSGIKDKATPASRPPRGRGETNWASRGPREVRGLAFERRLEAWTRQTMFPALAYYWVFWAGGTKSDGSDFDR